MFSNVTLICHMVPQDALITSLVVLRYSVCIVLYVFFAKYVFVFHDNKHNEDWGDISTQASSSRTFKHVPSIFITQVLCCLVNRWRVFNARVVDRAPTPRSPLQAPAPSWPCVGRVPP